MTHNCPTKNHQFQLWKKILNWKGHLDKLHLLHGLLRVSSSLHINKYHKFHVQQCWQSHPWFLDYCQHKESQPHCGEILVTVQTLADSLKICLMVGFFWLLRVQSKSPLLTLTSNSSSNDLLFSKSSFWQGEKTCSGAGGEADLSSRDGVFLVTGVKGPQELWPKFQVLD